jgi:hypothetical protein
VYFLDERSFPEPESFWVGGARNSTIVVQTDSPREVAVLQLRNAPVNNRVKLESGAWWRELQLGPGQQEQVGVPLDRRRRGAVIRIESPAGFRPAAHDPANRDQRFLGVWVKVE